MKQLNLKLKLACLFLFIFSIGNIAAQCPNFSASAVPTASTCQSNGTVTVTLGGTLTNISQVQYGLTGTPNAGGTFTINPQENNVLTNIPAGIYTVSVRAFCSVDASYNVVKTLTNVEVGGKYKVPTVSFNPDASRKSYDVCNTGIIALNVNDGSGTFAFNITSAPSGVPLGPITPTKVGNLYTLPGANYPAGNYTIQIQDNCYTSVATLTLGQISGFPPINVQYTSFYPTFVDGACNSVLFNPGSVSSGNADYYRYYTDGMYEMGTAKVATGMPTNFRVWNSSSSYTLDLSPYKISDFYGAYNLAIYLRLKNCPASYTTLNTYIKSPSPYNVITARNCDNYVYNVKPWYDYDGVVCYPAKIEVTKVSDGSPVYTNPAWSWVSTGQPVTLNYDVNYRVTITDGNNTVLTNTIQTNRNLNFSTNITSCDSYKLYYAVPTYNTCWPVDVTIRDAAGNVVCSDLDIRTTSYRQSCPLNYGQPYTFTVVYGNGYTYTTPVNVASALPTTATLVRSNSYNCSEDKGYFCTSVPSDKPWPVGTIITITGPTGYATQTYTATTSTWIYYWNSDNVYMPAGEYTQTINLGCGTPVVTKITQNGVYSGKNLDYTSKNVCGGVEITPTGLMTYQGANTTTYYRLFSGPAGYDKTVISPGGTFTLTIPGTYVLGILSTNDANGCVINTKTIVYTAPPMALDMTATGAYECTNGVGIIVLKAQNGVAPYTYEIWDKTNTTKLVPTNQVSSDAVHFIYGEADSTYMARIKDACGNNFAQPVTLAKLTTARIVTAEPPSVCSGETIVLKCTTLGTTTYRWTGPLNFDVTAQNTTRPNATVAMGGYYKVTVWPEFCGSPVTDSVYVTVYAPLGAGAVTPAQAICVRTPANAISCAIAGGSGTYTYQWQSSANGSSGWANISGATAATYMPPITNRSGSGYYRVIVTDRCGTVTSNVITVNNIPGYIPINPNLRSRTGS